MEYEYGDKRDYKVIELYNTDTGRYIASTTWARTLKIAVERCETKRPDLLGKVKAARNSL